MQAFDDATRKTLDNLRVDMRQLYDRFKGGEITRGDAAELANIAGKACKVEQLRMAGIALDRGLANLSLGAIAEALQPPDKKAKSLPSQASQ